MMKDRGIQALTNRLARERGSSILVIEIAEDNGVVDVQSHATLREATLPRDVVLKALVFGLETSVKHYNKSLPEKVGEPTSLYTSSDELTALVQKRLDMLEIEVRLIADPRFDPEGKNESFAASKSGALYELIHLAKHLGLDVQPHTPLRPENVVEEYPESDIYEMALELGLGPPSSSGH